MSGPRALVRDAKYVVAAAESLDALMEEAGQTFYSGSIPSLTPSSEDSLPETGLGVVPCSHAFLEAYRAPLRSPAWHLQDGCAYLEEEALGAPGQMTLFGD